MFQQEGREFSDVASSITKTFEEINNMVKHVSVLIPKLKALDVISGKKCQKCNEVIAIFILKVHFIKRTSFQILH